MMSGTLPTPNWDTWGQVPKVALWEGVALSMGLEPPTDDLPVRRNNPFAEIAEYNRRLRIVKGNLVEAGCSDEHDFTMSLFELCEVSLSHFAAWACSMEWEVPEEFAEIGKRAAGHSGAKASISQVENAPGSPESTKDPLAPRAETTYQNIIAALLAYIEGGIPSIEKHQSFSNRTAMIKTIAEHYRDYGGLSESNLSRKLPEAEKAIQTQ